MILKSIESPKHFYFKPGKWLWLFVLFFLPLFVALGFWQLNRAEQKEQLTEQLRAAPVLEQNINWQQNSSFQSFLVSGELNRQTIFLLDNKTHNGQIGYEVFVTLTSDHQRYLVSLGWVAGGADRSQLPTLVIPNELTDAQVMVRNAPSNALYDVSTNKLHEQSDFVWITQSLTTQWLQTITGQAYAGFLQLEQSHWAGMGINIWQPSVMTSTKHQAYALQWFGMAFALLGMFIYAGLRKQK